jgi:hypothetical protein
MPITNSSLTTKNQSFANVTSASNSMPACMMTYVCTCINNNQSSTTAPSQGLFVNLTVAAFMSYLNISANNQTMLNNTNAFNSTIVINYANSVYNILSNTSTPGISILLKNITLLNSLLPLPPYGNNNSQIIIPILTFLQNSNQSQNASNCSLICTTICSNNTNGTNSDNVYRNALIRAPWS